jgi:hypothetical protein
MLVYSILLAVLFVFVVLFLDIEFSLVKYDDNGWRFFVVGKLECGAPKRLATGVDDAQLRSSFKAGTSVSFYASHLPSSVNGFLLALPQLYGEPVRIGEEFAARGFQEPIATVLVHSVLRQFASRRDKMVFVDVGAGTGYFSALAASEGFACLTLEAHAQLGASLHATALANGWHGTNRSMLHMRAADAVSGQHRSLLVARERWHEARVFVRRDDDPTHAGVRDEHLTTTLTTTLDELVPRDVDVALLRLDAADYEVPVLQGAARLALSCRVHNILITRVSMSGDVFAKIRKVHELINKCRYRVKLFTEKVNAKKLCINNCVDKQISLNTLVLYA